MLTLGSHCLDSDRVSAANVAVPPVLPDETPLEPLSGGPRACSRALTECGCVGCSRRGSTSSHTRVSMIPRHTQ